MRMTENFRLTNNGQIKWMQDALHEIIDWIVNTV